MPRPHMSLGTVLETPQWRSGPHWTQTPHAGLIAGLCGATVMTAHWGYGSAHTPPSHRQPH